MCKIGRIVFGRIGARLSENKKMIFCLNLRKLYAYLPMNISMHDCKCATWSQSYDHEIQRQRCKNLQPK
jgi:hypothetical protein